MPGPNSRVMWTADNDTSGVRWYFFILPLYVLLGIPYMIFQEWREERRLEQWRHSRDRERDDQPHPRV